MSQFRAALSLFVFSVFLSPFSLFAQENLRFETGIHYLSLNHKTSIVTEERLLRSGFGGQFSINLTRNIAFDSELNFVPTAPADFSSTTGGRITQGLFGGKV